MRYVIVVAHPDDETIWAGGLAARLKCHIIACSIPKRDPIRMTKFYDAVKALGCTGEVLPVSENPPHPLDLSLLDLSEYDHIITHNEKGEYGHPMHIQVHNHICENYPDKRRSYFGYGHVGDDIRLTGDEILDKIAALKCYDHDNGIDGKPKWVALIERYNIDVSKERHTFP